MKLTPSRLALRISGVTILAIAGVRLAVDISRTVEVSEPVHSAGFIVGAGIEFTALALGAVGALSCFLGFRADKKHPQRR